MEFYCSEFCENCEYHIEQPTYADSLIKIMEHFAKYHNIRDISPDLLVQINSILR